MAESEQMKSSSSIPKLSLRTARITLSFSVPVMISAAAAGTYRVSVPSDSISLDRLIIGLSIGSRSHHVSIITFAASGSSESCLLASGNLTVKSRFRFPSVHERTASDSFDFTLDT